MNKNDLLDKVLKLKALADRGVAGEKENARKMLDALMKKYGIDEETLQENILKTRVFYYKNEWEDKLLCQLAYAMYPDRNVKVYTNKRYKANRCCILLDLTDVEVIEYEYAFEIYKNDLHKEMELFYTAFINTNKLFPEKTSIQTSVSTKEHSQTDIWKMVSYGANITKSNIRKALCE